MRMVLAPGEVFEHSHLAESVTTLIDGSVDVIIGETRASLVRGVPTRVPANLSHTLVNVGRDVAVVECGHELADPPASE